MKVVFLRLAGHDLSLATEDERFVQLTRLDGSLANMQTSLSRLTNDVQDQLAEMRSAVNSARSEFLDASSQDG
jgi:hypothetical protein